MELEPEIVERIKRYKRGNLIARLIGLAPVLFEDAAFLTLVVVWTATRTGSLVLMSTGGSRGPLWLWLLFVILSLLVLVFMLVTWTDKMTFRRAEGNESFLRFQSALEGLSIAAGIGQPSLLVVDAPTVNSLAIRSGKVHSVAITAPALEAGLSRQEAEAMMAHEVSHVLIGDGYRRATFRFRGATVLAFFAMVILPFVLVSFLIGFYWWIALALLAWTIAALTWSARTTRRFFRNDDQLADAIAVRLTSDPASLIETIKKLDEPYSSKPAAFPRGAIFPEHMFINRTRIDVRLENIRAIERGFAVEPGREA